MINNTHNEDIQNNKSEKRDVNLFGNLFRSSEEDHKQKDIKSLQEELMKNYLSSENDSIRQAQEYTNSKIADEQNRSSFDIEKLSNLFEASLDKGSFGELQFNDPLSSCLFPLLQALSWQGVPRNLAEALPFGAKLLNEKDFLNTLARIGFSSIEYDGFISDLDNRVLPALYLTEDGKAWIIRETNGRLARIYDGSTKSEKAVVLQEQRGRVILFKAVEQEYDGSSQDNEDKDWLKTVFARFKPTLWGLLGATAIINILSIILSLVIMSIYDMVIPAKSVDTLLFIGIGVFIALGVELFLRILKSSVVGFLGGRFEYLLSTTAFAKTLSMPLEVVENTKLGVQAARLKEFENIRDIFVGPFVSIGLELPFIVLFTAIIFAIGGPLAIIPIVVLILYAILTFSFVRKLQKAMKIAAEGKSIRSNFLLETFNYRQAIKYFRGEENWHENYRKISADASYLHYKMHKISGLMHVLSSAVISFTTAATMTYGAYLVLEDQLSIGGMIACMILSSKMLGPIQSLFLAFSRFENVKDSFKKLNKLMSSKSEAKKFSSYAIRRKISGSIEFDRVQFRYTSGQDVALMGINLKVNASEMLAIMGSSGSGKTTILKMILGLYRVPTGRIYIDGIDIRQLDPRELRHNIGYVPQLPKYFDGTIAQNLRLSDPTASDEQMRDVCAKLLILDSIDKLPNGFETKLSSRGHDIVSAGLKQAITVAAALIRKPSILLLDEPAYRMDTETDQAFTQLLENLKGQMTVIMTSHRPSHIKIADKLAVIERGMVVGQGKPEEILKQ